MVDFPLDLCAVVTPTGDWTIPARQVISHPAAPPGPRRSYPRVPDPPRNDPCTCGSGRKSKRCCWD